MTKQKYLGLKVGPRLNEEYIGKVYDAVDFLEIYASTESNFDILNSFNKPIVVHVMHFGNSVNFANPKRIKQNEAALSHAIKLADKFNASKLIFHPELKEDESCTVDVLKKFIKSHYDERLHIESMPFSSMGYKHFAASVDEIKNLLSLLGVKFCLDFAHTSEYLTKEKLPIELLRAYLALKPNHFHLTDTNLAEVFDISYNEKHLSLGEGNLDLEYCRDLLPDNCWITLETPPNAEKQLNELAFLRS